MSELAAGVAIRAEGLGKRYRIRRDVPAGSRMLREDLMGFLRGLTAPGGRKLASDEREVWAVRDLSLSIAQGEAFGLIGHNGAGKTTLLRLLSGITAPTEGRAWIRGRVGTLLEVGTGFHFELTGRENVYLQAAVLGMKRAEVTHRLPSIVAMAGIGEYLDVPVKRYSTGMFVRLAFAVAAHLDTEILLVDEILAVGDAEFRRQCLSTIDRAVRGGRTVVFVSHNTASIEQICTRAAYLAHGRIELIGTATEAVRRYHENRDIDAPDLLARSDREGTGSVIVETIELLDEQYRPLPEARAGSALSIRLRYRCPAAPPSGSVRVQLVVHTHLDTPVFVHDNEYSLDPLGSIGVAGALRCALPRLALPASAYRLSYKVWVAGVLVDGLADAAVLRVVSGDYYESGLLPDARDAVCLADASWTHEA